MTQNTVYGQQTIQQPSQVRPNAESWSLPLDHIYNNPSLRLDASHYLPKTNRVVQEIQNSTMPVKRLEEVADIYLPGHFTRIWAKDPEHGIPYLNATDLMSLTGIGMLPGQKRYISLQSKVDIDVLIIKEGWLLISCSGTIGRVFYVPKRLDGWVATHDLIRVRPHDLRMVGYLHAFLSSDYAQEQMLAHSHGGQIDHITDAQAASVLVPIPAQTVVDDIHEKTMAALDHRERAIQDLEHVSLQMRGLLKDER
ncbi:MAG: restriction endonuclease subunit S [Eubacteriales bacterium]|nr:restriction endonuclease subunit S [Christensenellaceae bacterium]MEA5067178.1 restriction endonuclease subunit S [Eubacteriales bacterium]